MNFKSYFEKNGFVLLKNVLDNHEADILKNIGNELENLPETKGKWMIYYESNENDEKIKTRIENFINFHPTLKKFLYDVVIPKIQAIYDKELVLFKDKMNWKRSGGKGFHAHQDQPAWNDFKGKIYHTVALFVDTSTIEKGCLEFVENFKDKNLLCYNENGHGGLTKEIEDTFTWVPQETTPRDILFFNSFVPHRSGVNRSKESRRIIYFTFNNLEDGQFYDDYIKKKREEFPPDIERDNTKEYKVLGNKYNLANPIN